MPKIWQLLGPLCRSINQRLAEAMHVPAPHLVQHGALVLNH